MAGNQFSVPPPHSNSMFTALPLLTVSSKCESLKGCFITILWQKITCTGDFGLKTFLALIMNNQLQHVALHRSSSTHMDTRLPPLSLEPSLQPNSILGFDLCLIHSSVSLSSAKTHTHTHTHLYTMVILRGGKVCSSVILTQPSLPQSYCLTPPYTHPSHPTPSCINASNPLCGRVTSATVRNRVKLSRQSGERKGERSSTAN